MADNNTRVKIIDIQVKYEDAINAMAQYRQSIDEAKAAMQALKKDVKDGKVTQEEYNRQSEASKVFIKQQTEAVNTLSKQIGNQVKVTKEQDGSLKQLRAQLSNATAAYDAMSRAEREGAKGQELKQHIADITNELKEAEEGTLRFYRNVGNYPESVSSSLSGIKGLFNDVKDAIKGVALGGSILSFGDKVVEVGRSIDDGMARVRAVTQATDEEFELLKNKAVEVGSATAYSITDAANALENLTRNGLNAVEATEVLYPTLEFAQANTIGLAEAADLQTNVLNGFNLAVAEAGRVSDNLSYTASHSATTVLALGEALKNAAPFGAALGQPIEEVNAALGVLANVGIKGSDAGTAIRQVLTGLATSTAKQQAVFKEFGIEISQETMKVDGLTKTLEKLRDSGIMQSAESANKLGDIFGRRVAPQAMALLGNIDGLRVMLDGLNNSTGTTANMFDKSMSQMSLALSELDSAWEAFMYSIYDGRSDAMVGPIQVLTKGINWLAENMPIVAKVVMTAIASITFAKLLNSAIGAFTRMKDSAVANAQAATNAVSVCQSKERLLRRQTEILSTQLAASSGKERERIEVMLVAKKKELAEAEKAVQKAKNTEIVMWNRAAALQTGNAWQQGFAVAKAGVLAFATTAKVALKSIMSTTVIGLIMTGIMELVNWFTQGEEAVEDLTEAQKKANAEAEKAKRLSDGRAELEKKVGDAVAEQTVKVNALKEAILDTNSAESDRKKAIDALKKIIPTYNGMLGDEKKLTEDTTLAISNYITGLQKAARARALFDKMTELESQRLVLNKNKSDAEDALTSAYDSLADYEKANPQARKAYEAMSVDTQNDPDKGVYHLSSMARQNLIDSGKYEARDFAYGENSDALKEEEAKLLQLAQGYKAIMDSAVGATESITSSTEALSDFNKEYDYYKGEADKNSKEFSNIITNTPSTPTDPKEETAEERKKREAAERAARARQKAAEEEAKLVAQAEKAKLELLGESVEKRRALIENQYDGEINKLKVKLATDQTLTEKSKDAIRQLIEAKERAKDEALKNLSNDELQRTIEREQKLVSSKLSIIEKGSAEELKLKQQQVTNKMQLDLIALDEEEKTALKGAETTAQYRKKEYEDLCASNTATQEERTKASLAYEIALQNLVDIGEEYTQRRLNTQEAYNKQWLQLQEEHTQDVQEQEMLVLKNEIADLDLRNTERYNNDASYREVQESIGELGLDVVTEHEFEKMELQRQMAEENLEFILEQGQLAEETEVEYNARILAGKQELADAKKKINEAQLKNEKAYAKAMESVGDSLISVLDAVGKNDKNFAMLSKVITLFKITVDTGKALSSGIASAMELPYPANLAAVATTVATVLANIATAVSTVQNANFAEGGKVNGPGTSTSDSIPANLSNGEFVMTAKATKIFEPLLVAMNAIGKGVPMQVSRSYERVGNAEMISQSFSSAVENIQVVASVEEITEVQSRLQMIENLATMQ